MLPRFELMSLTIFTYPLIVGLAWGLVISMVKVENQKASVPIERLNWLLLGVFFSSWLGAKLLFLLTVNESSVLITRANFWLGGGFVFYGGLILSIVFVGILIKLKKIECSSIKYFNFSFNFWPCNWKDCLLFFLVVALGLKAITVLLLGLRMQCVTQYNFMSLSA